MKIAMFAFGSQGDVQPYVALGKGLQQAGHTVRFVTHENFDTLVQPHGLEFWPTKGNVQDIAESPEMRALLEKGNFIAITRHTTRAATEAAIGWATEGLKAAQDADVIVTGVGGLFIGVALAEKLGVPLVQAYIFPFTPTAAFPGILFPKTLGRLGGAFNRFSHQLVRQAIWQGVRSADTAARKVIDLPTAPFFGPYNAPVLERYPTLYGFSPSVIQQPNDWKNTQITGYWFLDAATDWTPPADLSAFLEAGPPPVYIGFGSMGNRNPEETADLVLKALAQTKQRAVLLSGWSGMHKANMPETVFLSGPVPHAWLFGRMAAVVHHGGAGTTAAGLRAGVPSVVIPFFADQPYWGQRVADLGVGTAPIPRKQLTAEHLAAAIQTAVTDQPMRQRAATLGSRIRAENGLANAVAIIEQIQSGQVLAQSRAIVRS